MILILTSNDKRMYHVLIYGTFLLRKKYPHLQDFLQFPLCSFTVLGLVLLVQIILILSGKKDEV